MILANFIIPISEVYSRLSFYLYEFFVEIAVQPEPAILLRKAPPEESSARNIPPVVVLRADAACGRFFRLRWPGVLEKC